MPSTELKGHCMFFSVGLKKRLLSFLDGGDYFLIEAFVDAVAAQDPTKILSGPQESLTSHAMVFAAEKARRIGQVVQMAELLDVGGNAPSKQTNPSPGSSTLLN